MANKVNLPGIIQVQVHAMSEDVEFDLTNISQLGLDVLVERGLGVLTANAYISAVREACQEVGPPQDNNGASIAACTPEQRERAKHIYKTKILPGLKDKILAGEFQPGQRGNPKASGLKLFKLAHAGREPNPGELEEFMTSPAYVRGQKRIDAERLAEAQARRAKARSTDQTVLELLVEQAIAEDGLSPNDAITQVFRTCKSVKNIGELLAAVQETFAV